MEQECIAMEKQNSITNKFQKKTLLHLQQQPFVKNLWNNFCNELFSLLVWYCISFVSSPAINTQQQDTPANEQAICMRVVDKHTHCCA